MMLFLLALLYLMGTGDATYRNDLVAEIIPHANTHWGSWGRKDMCPVGYYAYGFQLKVEGYQGTGDDTAVNGIRLHCKNDRGNPGHDITSKVMKYGKWERISHNCPAGTFLRGVSIKSETNQGSGSWLAKNKNDDTAATNLEFTCQSPAGVSLKGNGLKWGSWSNRVHCPARSVICGIKTRVEGKQGSGDDTALNEAIFYCCRK